jgi:hypothetical protein
MTTHTVDPVLCMALFVSDASQTSNLDNSAIRDTATGTLDRLGPDECYARAAEVFGDHPELAVGRMAWARETCSRAMTLAAI